MRQPSGEHVREDLHCRVLAPSLAHNTATAMCSTSVAHPHPLPLTTFHRESNGGPIGGADENGHKKCRRNNNLNWCMAERIRLPRLGSRGTEPPGADGGFAAVVRAPRRRHRQRQPAPGNAPIHPDRGARTPLPTRRASGPPAECHRDLLPPFCVPPLPAVRLPACLAGLQGQGSCPTNHRR